MERDLDRRLTALLERYEGLIRAAIARVCPRELAVDVEDVVQEARIRLWRALERATEEAPAPSYIYRAAASAAIDAVRAATARRERVTSLEAMTEEGVGRSEPAELGSASGPEGALARRELARAVEGELAAMAENRRRALRLHFWGLTSPEIGRLTGWSETKTRSLISRGLSELRQRLRVRGVDDDAIG